MESRLAATARATFRVISGHQCLLRRGLAKVPMPTRRIADSAIHSEAPTENDEEVPVKAAAKATKQKASTIDYEPYVLPQPPIIPSPKLQSTAVNEPIDPTPQQKRRQTTTTTITTTTTTTNTTPPLVEANCAGLDGSPWPDDQEEDMQRQKREKEKNFKKYFSQHKASPLSEIEVVDTRKPITRVTDDTADSIYVGYEGIPGVVLWREEQLDTAEDSLRRAMEIWKQSAMRGDPDSPHGRVLRALRGENW